MGLNRRQFLGTLSAGTLALAGAKSASAKTNFTGYPDSYGMLIDTTECIGTDCRRCEEACKKINDRSLEGMNLSDNTVFDKRRRTDSDNLAVVNRFDDPRQEGKHIFVKHQCMHCLEPACASACMVKALIKTPEGPVIYDKDLCVGCRYCMVACPFDVPSYDFFDPLTPEVRKCDMCFEKIKKGERPACVEICPKETITFGRRKDMIQLAREKIRKHPDRYVDYIYGENEVGGTSVMYLTGVDSAKLGFKTDLGTGKYGELTLGPISMVPMILITWPLLMVGLRQAVVKRNENEETPHEIKNQGGK